jgi:putative NIF3 family GTP cyclohydrolase 1 type 2
MKKILADNEKNSMLFVHHPSIWDITKTPIFQQMDMRLLQRFKNNNISIYNLHVPLDNYGQYSTSVTLAKALGISSQKPFAPYYGGMCGVFGKTALSTVKDLKAKFEKVIGHKASLYDYGPKKIENGTVAIVAGGGNDIDVLEEIVKTGATTFVTGITALNPHSKDAHEFAKKHKISILGGTHYSTEKFACIAMVDYFKRQGLESEFIDGKPGLEDL